MRPSTFAGGSMGSYLRTAEAVTTNVLSLMRPVDRTLVIPDREWKILAMELGL